MVQEVLQILQIRKRVLWIIPLLSFHASESYCIIIEILWLANMQWTEQLGFANTQF